MKKIFKAKRLDDGEWVEFNIVDMFFGDDRIYHLDKNTICQYTGVDAANGKIFEGDYFDCDGVCVFKEGAFRYVTEKNDKSLTAGCLNLKLNLTGHNIHDKD